MSAEGQGKVQMALQMALTQHQPVPTKDGDVSLLPAKGHAVPSKLRILFLWRNNYTHQHRLSADLLGRSSAQMKLVDQH